MSGTTIPSGTSSGNFAVNSGDVVSVFGTTTDVLVNGGGQEVIYAGGTTISTTATGPGVSGVGGSVIVSSGGTTSFTTVSNGGYESLSGGDNSAVSTMVGSDSYIRVFSGGTLLGTTVNSGGSDYVYSGVASDTTLNGAGTFEYVAGGSAVSTTVNSGATQELYNSGIALPTTVNSGGTQVIYAGGSAVSATISGGGFQTVSSGGTASDTQLGSGGSQTIGAGGSATSTTVSSGGYEIISSGGSATDTTISNGATEVISVGGSATDTDLLSGGSIDVTYLNDTSGATASVNSSTDVLTISAGGQVYTQQLSGDYAGEYAHFTSGPGGGLLLTVNDTPPPCYGHGTRLRTDHGEVAVEHLAVGDYVRTLSGSARPIRWIGHRHIDLHRHPAPEQVQPILIRTNAVADGVPGRDLRVSPDHAVLLDGMLIPARLLINGASILRETQCRTITYYHVELETHDILFAEALPAESYLDTGNRGTFENAGAPMVLHPDFDGGQQRREVESCRPFVDDAASVEPIWRRLAMRAARLGLDLPARTETTRDPGLRVVADGRTIMPVSSHAGRFTFVLPATRGPVRLVSRAARPCDVRPWVEDRRRLGVMVSRVMLTRGTDIELLPLDHPHLSRGWWDVERDGSSFVRWTDGSAVIPLSLMEPAMLDIAVAGSLDYPLDREAEDKVAEAAAA